jgi:hypothetical protein
MLRLFSARQQPQVFVNEDGDIVIKQSDDYQHSLVCIDVGDIDTLVASLKEAKRKRQRWRPEQAERGTDAS